MQVEQEPQVGQAVRLQATVAQEPHRLYQELQSLVHLVGVVVQPLLPLLVGVVEVIFQTTLIPQPMEQQIRVVVVVDAGIQVLLLENPAAPASSS